MKGKSLNHFIKDLYYNPEIEIYLGNTFYLISGCVDLEKHYTLEVWRQDSGQLIFSVTDTDRQKCVETFENAKIFDGKTIYEAEKDITVHFG